jgi:hypothetical protein
MGAVYWGCSASAVLGAKLLVQFAICYGGTPHLAPLAPMHYLLILIREPHQEYFSLSLLFSLHS